MFAKTIMIQGTGSHVGKTVLVAALCRIFTEDGFRVAPFKAQNMALNSFVTPDGLEIGRAQAMQAQACRREPQIDMNPILMKPNTDTEAQIILHGKPVGNMNVQQYRAFKQQIFPLVVESLNRLREENDIVVLEGAGSPAEINLRDEDIVNMKMALNAGASILLAGDIDRGGVFASLIGTLELLEPEERNRIAAFVINKFRGDPSLLRGGIDFLTLRSGLPVLGIVPYISDLRIAEEDTVPFRRKENQGAKRLRIRVILFRHLSNFTDFDPLLREPDVDFGYAKRPEECLEADLLILPGTKNTCGDLEDLRRRGFDALLDHKNRTAFLLGICGGYQMLTERIEDPERVESDAGRIAGLGLIPATTIFEKQKQTRRVTGILYNTNIRVSGYEIHHGRVSFSRHTPLFHLNDRDATVEEGYCDFQRKIFGTSLHGIFDDPKFRRWFLNLLRKERRWDPLPAQTGADPDLHFRRLARIVRENVNVQLLYQILENGRNDG